VSQILVINISISTAFFDKKLQDHESNAYDLEGQVKDLEDGSSGSLSISQSHDKLSIHLMCPQLLHSSHQSIPVLIRSVNCFVDTSLSILIQ